MTNITYIKTLERNIFNTTFYIDIMNDNGTLEAFLYSWGYGIKSLIFGVPETVSVEKFESMVLNDIHTFAFQYIKDHMDEDEFITGVFDDVYQVLDDKITETFTKLEERYEIDDPGANADLHAEMCDLQEDLAHVITQIILSQKGNC